MPTPSMAAPMPFPFTAHIPVTPPPDIHMFMKGPPPVNLKPSPLGVSQVTSPFSAQQQPASRPPQSSQQPPTAPPLGPTTGLNPPLDPADPAEADTGNTAPAASASASTPPIDAALDPRYIAMASRIASYYQQRCQAVAQYQHQRCQEWASVHRRRCQEMMQAATVVVAWYIRDRIARRRRRRRRAFRRGLAGARAGAGTTAGDGGRVTKREAVRAWLMDMSPARGWKGDENEAGTTGDGSPRPDAAAGAAVRTPPRDKEEADFDVDRDVPADKDTQLFNVADNLIKSHLARVDVPMLGVLSFEESDSDSESEEDDFMDYGDEEAERDDGEEEEPSEESEEEEYGYKDEEGEVDEETCGEEAALTVNSRGAQLGTTIKGSRKRSRSSMS